MALSFPLKVMLVGINMGVHDTEGLTFLRSLLGGDEAQATVTSSWNESIFIGTETGQLHVQSCSCDMMQVPPSLVTLL